VLHGRCMSGLLVKQNVSRAVDGSKIPHEHYLIRNAPRCPLALAQHLPHIEERLPRTSAVSMALLQVSFALTKALFLLSGLCCSTRALYLLHLPYCRSLSLLPGLFSSYQGSVAAPARRPWPQPAGNTRAPASYSAPCARARNSAHTPARPTLRDPRVPTPCSVTVSYCRLLSAVNR
jgi:hypothetical protein